MTRTSLKEPPPTNSHHEVTQVVPAEPFTLPPRRLLIVEDNDAGRRQLQKLLQEEPDLQVESTDDGTKALQELTRHPYSLVITDLRLPGMDGMDLIKQIQERNLPVTVIVTTGHGSIDEAVQAIRS